MSESDTQRTWYEHACSFVDEKWPHASPRHRRSIAEALTTVTVALVSSDKGAPCAVHWVKTRQFRPPSAMVPPHYANIESDTNSLLGECSIPPRPAGRLWLLKPPPHFDSVEKALEHLLASTKALGEDIMASANFAAHVDRELRRLFSPTG